MIINGIASVKGFGASATATYTGVLATLKPVKGSYKSQADIEELKDGEGNVVAKGANNSQQRASLSFILTGADIATAKTLVEPAPLAVITLASANHAALNGTWNYESGFTVETGPEFAKVSAELSRVAGAALTAAS